MEALRNSSYDDLWDTISPVRKATCSHQVVRYMKVSKKMEKKKFFRIFFHYCSPGSWMWRG